MNVAETEKFLHYRVEALENALQEAQTRLGHLKTENAELKRNLLQTLLKR